MHTFWKLGRK